MPTAFQYLFEVTSALPSLIKAGVDVYDILTKTNEEAAKMEAEGRKATKEERDAMRAYLESLRTGRPLPDKGEAI